MGDESQIVSIPRDGSGREAVLLRTTSFVNNVAMGPDGSIYLDQMNRPSELVRFAPSTGQLERTPLPPSIFPGVFPLRDGKVLAAQRTRGRTRIVAYAPGKDPTDFLGSRATSTFPIASLGSEQALLRLTDSSGTALVAANASTGSITMRQAGLDYESFAGSPDGKTIFFADSGAIWSMPAAGGQRRRLAEGSAVATDPGGHYVVSQVVGSDGVRLLHVPLDGGPPHQITVHGDTPVSLNPLAPNAVAADGRIVVEVVSKASWFWPAAILDPVTGKLSIVPPGLSYDMYLGGWDTEGHVVTTALGLESALWRFRPVKPSAR
jgi:hypothetical protein